MKLFNGKIYNLIRTLIFLFLAVFVIISMQVFDLLGKYEIVYLRYFIGSLMIFYGAEEIVYTAFNNKKHYSVRSLYWNIVEMVLGIVMIVFVENGDKDVTYAVVCVSWATWSILRETRELVEATLEFKENVTSPVNILESLVVIALSITMIIEPTKHHAGIHLCLLVLELTTKAVFPVIDAAGKPLMEKLLKKRGAKKRDGDTPLLYENTEEEQPVDEQIIEGEDDGSNS